MIPSEEVLVHLGAAFFLIIIAIVSTIFLYGIFRVFFFLVERMIECFLKQ